MLLKKNKGITLVALVITIVVLLILAGISISALTNTGIFGKAIQSKEKSEESQEEEIIKLALYSKALNKYVNNDKDKIGERII